MTKASELRELTDDVLELRLAEAKDELLKLRFGHATGQLDDTNRLPVVRREIARIRAAQLKRHRMLAAVETQQPLPIAMQDGAGRQHLRVKPRMPRHQAMEHTAMPVGPVHHRGYAKT